MKLSQHVNVSWFLALLAATATAAPVTFRPFASIEIPASKGRFDLLRIDARRHRLLAGHEADGTADYFDLATHRLIARVKVGGAVDNAVDSGSRHYYVSVPDRKRVAVVDAATLREVGSIALDGPTDAILYEPRNHRVYVTHDDGSSVWVIDPARDRVVGSVEVPGAPELMEYDPSRNRIYLNIKSKDVVAVIDPRSNTTVAQWPTAPATHPHGLALDVAHHRIFVAGANGKLSVLDTHSGKLLGSVDIAERVDEIAFDPARKLLYCAGTGKMSVIRVSGDLLSEAGDFPTAPAARNVAVDERTGAVWTTYSDGKSSFARAWLPQR